MMKTLSRFEEYLKVYSKSDRTIRAYLLAVREFLEFCRREGMDPNEEALRQFMVALRLDGKSQNTIYQYFHGVKAFFEFLGIKVSVKSPPLARKKIEDVPSIEEINKLIMKIPEIRDKALIAIGYDTGARINEVRHIRVGDLDLERGVVRIGRLKKRNAGEREEWGSVLYHYVPLRSITISVLREYLEVSGITRGWLFPGRNGKDPISESDVRWIVYKWTEKILGKRYSPHVLFRHARGSHLAQHNVSPFIIRDLLGHSNVKTTDIYVKPLKPEELRNMLPPEVL